MLKFILPYVSNLPFISWSHCTVHVLILVITCYLVNYLLIVILLSCFYSTCYKEITQWLINATEMIDNNHNGETEMKGEETIRAESNTWARGIYCIWTVKTINTKKNGDTQTRAHTGRKLWVKRNQVPTEQKVHSQGRMLGYLFFSLLSSLLASSYVPWALPPGKDYKTENAVRFCTSHLKQSGWLLNRSCVHCVLPAVCKALPLLHTITVLH